MTALPCNPTVTWVMAEGYGFLLPLRSCVLWERLKNSLGPSVPLCVLGVAETYDVLPIPWKRKPLGDPQNLLFPDVPFTSVLV